MARLHCITAGDRFTRIRIHAAIWHKTWFARNPLKIPSRQCTKPKSTENQSHEFTPDNPIRYPRIAAISIELLENLN